MGEGAHDIRVTETGSIESQQPHPRPHWYIPGQQHQQEIGSLGHRPWETPQNHTLALKHSPSFPGKSSTLGSPLGMETDPLLELGPAETSLTSCTHGAQLTPALPGTMGKSWPDPLRSLGDLQAWKGPSWSVWKALLFLPSHCFNCSFIRSHSLSRTPICTGFAAVPPAHTVLRARRML